MPLKWRSVQFCHWLIAAAFHEVSGARWILKFQVPERLPSSLWAHNGIQSVSGGMKWDRMTVSWVRWVSLVTVHYVWMICSMWLSQFNLLIYWIFWNIVMNNCVWLHVSVVQYFVVWVCNIVVWFLQHTYIRNTLHTQYIKCARGEGEREYDCNMAKPIYH